MTEFTKNKMKLIGKIILLLIPTLICFSLIVVFVDIGINLAINLTERNLNTIPRDVLQEYNYIKSILDNPDRKQKTVTDGLSNFMGSEWPVMTLSLASYGMRNLAIQYPALKKEAVSDLPPKKWTQRRVSVSIGSALQTGGVQWERKA